MHFVKKLFLTKCISTCHSEDFRVLLAVKCYTTQIFLPSRDINLSIYANSNRTSIFSSLEKEEEAKATKWPPASTGVHVSDQTARIRLYKLGMRAQHPLVRPVLTTQHHAPRLVL